MLRIKNRPFWMILIPFWNSVDENANVDSLIEEPRRQLDEARSSASGFSNQVSGPWVDFRDLTLKPFLREWDGERLIAFNALAFCRCSFRFSACSAAAGAANLRHALFVCLARLLQLHKFISFWLFS
eukprot:GABV01013760.1.p1 GENE.GABV01013760.1~~GABV01013760.1.p1  ORF type:complete len:127 (-),score=42.10 GABV01013760.1:20-400(-)